MEELEYEYKNNYNKRKEKEDGNKRGNGKEDQDDVNALKGLLNKAKGIASLRGAYFVEEKYAILSLFKTKQHIIPSFCHFLEQKQMILCFGLRFDYCLTSNKKNQQATTNKRINKQQLNNQSNT